MKDNGSNDLNDQLRRALGLDESFPKTYTGQNTFEIIVGKYYLCILESQFCWVNSDE
jgi:hypothetical protein